MDGSLTRDQILEEIEESADQHYREIWKKRSEDERVLLEHVARHGLASAASRRVVRKLLAAGLLRKDPELRLMSESFRRFVLEPERRREVAALEQQAAPSLWDRLRIPLAMSGTLALLFLLVTQREALDTTVSMALGVTTAGADADEAHEHAGAAGRRKGRPEGGRLTHARRSVLPACRGDAQSQGRSQLFEAHQSDRLWIWRLPSC